MYGKIDIIFYCNVYILLNIFTFFVSEEKERLNSFDVIFQIMDTQKSFEKAESKKSSLQKFTNIEKLIDSFFHKSKVHSGSRSTSTKSASSNSKKLKELAPKKRKRSFTFDLLKKLCHDIEA